MSKYHYDNVLDNYDITIQEKNDGFFMSENHHLNWQLPNHIAQFVNELKDKHNLTLNELAPLYADFDISVNRDASYTLDPLLKGVETAYSGQYSVEDFTCILNFEKITLRFFDELGEELGEFDVSDYIEDFETDKNDDWIHGNTDGLFLLYETVGNKASQEDIND